MVSHKQEMPNSKIFQAEAEPSQELMEVLLAMKLLDTEFSDHSLMKNWEAWNKALLEKNQKKEPNKRKNKKIIWIKLEK